MEIIVLTDASTLEPYDSIYDLISALSELSADVWLASRSDPKNIGFFNAKTSDIWARPYNKGFSYETKDRWFTNSEKRTFESFPSAWLRLDQPVSRPFLLWLSQHEKHTTILNNPRSLIEIGSKLFLENFQEFIPGFSPIHDYETLVRASLEMAQIVYKPSRGYGGHGIRRIIDGRLDDGINPVIKLASAEARKELDGQFPGIAMRYLPRVSDGDKRTVVCGGEVIGSVLRVPAKGKWLANLAQGATSKQSSPTQEELAMIAAIDPILSDKGIILYGIDTLTGDDGTRILSEINSVNVGGIRQISSSENRPDIFAQVANTHMSRWSSGQDEKVSGLLT